MSRTSKAQSGPPSLKRTHMSLTIRDLMDSYFYRIDLDADYQREKVWSKTNQEELLDSIIKDIDIPKLYLARVRGNKQFDYECIDGKQRLLTLANFLTPRHADSSPLLIDILHKKFSFEELTEQHPNIAKSILDYKLDFVVYDETNLTDTFVREIFRRLQLGIRLNSGEILNSQVGAIRDFVFKENGKDAPFLRNTKLSDRRYSRQFTLAQICINSFHRKKHGDFIRARLSDLEDFFAEKGAISFNDDNLNRVRKVLRILDKEFAESAKSISSRAVAVSAYLFVESLYEKRKLRQVPQFVKFYAKLLEVIRNDMELVSKYKKPKNAKVLEEFQKNVLQASVEPSAIRRRDDFLKRAFDYYGRPATKGQVIGS